MPNAPVQPPSEPQPGDAQTEPARGLKGSGLRYTAADGVPEWAIGKTADELVTMTQTVYDKVLQGNAYAPPVASQPAYNAPVAPSYTPAQNGPPDTALLYTQPDEYNRQLSAWQQRSTEAAFQAASAPFLAGQVELARAEARRSPKNAEVWRRYEPEIVAELANLPTQLKANPKIWNDAADLVAGRHSEDLFRDRIAATRPADTGISSVDGMSRGGLNPSTMTPVQKAWREDAPWIQQFKRLPGMTLPKLQAQVAKMGSSEADYVKHYETKNAMRIHNSDGELAQFGVAV